MAFDFMAAIESVQTAATVEPQDFRRTDAQIVPASRPGRLEVWLPPTCERTVRAITLPASERIARNESNGLRWGGRVVA